MRAVTTILLAACTAEDAVVKPPAEVEPVEDTGAAERIAPPPSMDAAAVQAEAAALLDTLPDAATALADWRDLFVGASMPCPGITAPFSITAPFAGCVAADGREWAGYAVYTESGDPYDVLLEADASVAEDGATFVAAGKAHLALDGVGGFDTSIAGTWGGDGRADWTGPGPSVALWAEGDADTVDLYGGVSLAGAAVSLADIAWDADACPGATGEVSIRDPNGWWYTLVLDADCSGCGPLTYGDEDLGPACVDLGAPIAALAEVTLAAKPPEPP